MTLLLIIGGVLGAGILLIIHGTIFKTRWGISTAVPVECPSCHKMHGQIRVPRNLRQTLWGGFTCDRCGLETDKWDRPILRQPTINV